MNAFSLYALPFLGGPTKHVPTDSSSGECFETIRHWLQSCVQSHRACQSTGSRLLPKRVIDVGRDDEHIKIRLHESDIDERGDYVALSHCWGSTLHTTTTEATLPQWKHGIPWGSLSKTFQDAVMITRKLGLKYLWADALCIIQDDEKDWQIESAKMGSIYQDAFLVISASSALDGDGGCFSQRLSPAEITVTEMGGRTSSVFVRKGRNHNPFNWFFGSNGGQYDHKDYPLYKRAWCFQERLLSTRILHYTRSEMVWECLSMMNCECASLDHWTGDDLFLVRQFLNPAAQTEQATQQLYERWQDLRARYNRMQHDKLQHPFDTFADVTQPENPAVVTESEIYVAPVLTDKSWLFQSAVTERFASNKFILGHRFQIDGSKKYDKVGAALEVWRDVVKIYSGKRLTFARDILPALSGLASKWSALGCGQYLAGLWESDLLHDLLWKTTHGEPRQTEGYVAPSWSWASSLGGVEWFSPMNDAFTFFVKVNEAKCTPKGLNPFGEVSSGSIRLTGTIYGARVKEVNYGYGLAGSLFNHGPPGIFFYSDSLEQCRGFLGQEVYYMPVCAETKDGSIVETLEYGLVLCAGTRIPGTFERIGIRMGQVIRGGAEKQVIIVV